MSVAKWLIYSKKWEEASVNKEDPSIKTVMSEIRGRMARIFGQKESMISEHYKWASTVKTVIGFLALIDSLPFSCLLASERHWNRSCWSGKPGPSARQDFAPWTTASWFHPT